MSNLLEKIENFLFDILGLMLPGLIFLGLLLFPLISIHAQNITAVDLNNSYILSALTMAAKVFDRHWHTDPHTVIFVIILAAYLIGHVIKVLSIIVYDFFVAFFDKSINKLVILFTNQIAMLVGTIHLWAFKKQFSSTGFYIWLKQLLRPFKTLVNKIFYFSSSNFFPENKSLKSDCVRLINERTNQQYPDEWYSLYKFSTVIIQQENIKSLTTFFLSKYNLYRSLSVIFLFVYVYYDCFFKVSSHYLSGDVKKMDWVVLMICGFFWFTFHTKYKRYWTLCGNESLVSLFYFLNKKNINEN